MIPMDNDRYYENIMHSLESWGVVNWLRKNQAERKKVQAVLLAL